MVPDGWRRVCLDHLMDFANGLNTDKASYGRGAKFANVMDVFGNDRLTEESIIGRVEITPLQLRNFCLRHGDVVFNRTSEVPEEIAMSATYLDKDNIVVFGGFVIRGRPKTDDLLPEYTIYCFQADDFRNQAIKRGQGAVRSNIGQKDIRTISVSVPPAAEQIKIAQILSTWDQAIETTEKLIENSKAQKKALMQQLLTGKKRLPNFVKNNKRQQTRFGLLPNEWRFVPIGDVADERSERAGENVDLPVLSCSKYEGFVDSLQYFKKKVYSDDTSTYKVVRGGDYGFPSNHIEEGSIGYQDIYNAGIVSPIYSVFRTSAEVHDAYLYRVLKTDHYRQIFAASTNASVDRRGSLRWKEFSKIRVPLPPLPEQQAIAECVDVADRELAGLKDQCIFLSQEKRALMQQLLTGKRRVKVPA